MSEGYRLAQAKDQVEEGMRQQRAWTILTYGDDRSYGGNKGYEDERGQLFRYDSYVPNHKQVKIGDIVLMLTRHEVLGLAHVESITSIAGTKSLQRCPQCRAMSIKARKTKQPLFRCQRCGFEFNDPLAEQVRCELYTALFGSSFIPTPALHRETIGPLYCNYNGQLAIQEVNQDGLQTAITKIYPVAVSLFGAQTTALQTPDPTPAAGTDIGTQSPRVYPKPSRASEDSASDYDIAAPQPGAMIESLRAIGYDLTTAVADLIDNSISASASNIWIEFEWSGKSSRFHIIDDGCGMNEVGLVNAMRMGSRSPLDERAIRDLGRFGLGMKTASLSQCQRMTVASRVPEDQVHVRCWDVNYVTEVGEWRLLRQGAEDTAELLQQAVGDSSGTVVLWDQMDHLVSDSPADNPVAEAMFAERINRVYHHVAMIFHRFLERPDPLRIHVNGRSVKAWDPYLRKDDSTQRLPNENLYFHGQRIQIHPYVLPHHSKINQDTHKLASGPNGWNAQQGFYVYRNDRLLVAGDWLGLGYQKEEHYKLARIALDIPNTMDNAWELDVKKARAKPPVALRADLKRIALLARERASDVYRQRGKIVARKNSTGQTHFVWERYIRGEKISYRINRVHPLVQETLADVPDSKKLRSLLRLIEETTPVPLIVIDHAEQPDQHNDPFQSVPTAELQAVLEEVYESLQKSGSSPGEARERLTRMEPFDRYLEVVMALADK